MVRGAVLLAGFLAARAVAAPLPVGHYNNGRLIGGISLHELILGAPSLLASVSPEEFQYGTEELGRALLLMGEWARDRGLAPLRIGDTSKKGGGRLARHLTHQLGLDADVAYIPHEPRAEGHRWRHFHNRFTERFESGRVVTRNFDLPANYALIRHVSEKAEIRAIYVGCRINRALRTHDRLLYPPVPGPVVPRSEFLDAVYPDPGHEDHFHVRLRCPAAAPECTHAWWRDPDRPPAPPRRKRNVDRYGCPLDLT